MKPFVVHLRPSFSYKLIARRRWLSDGDDDEMKMKRKIVRFDGSRHIGAQELLERNKSSGWFKTL